MSDDERDLRDLFARLKAEERAHVAPFRTPKRRAEPRPLWVPRIAAAAAIALIAFVLARPDRPRRLVAFQPDLGAVIWQSPTDFLLATPGRELMRTVPAVGSPDESRAIDRYRSLIPESTRTTRTPS